jgi:hypothetical protein
VVTDTHLLGLFTTDVLITVKRMAKHELMLLVLTDKI